jgi:prepilin-type N-terminal cleavage/methylation domain-containing protein
MIRLDKNERGVSLIEIMLVVAIIVVLSAITLPIQNSILTSNYVADGISNIQSALRTASLQARLSADDLAAGVWFGKTADGKPEVVAYRGESYITRNKEYDVQVEVAGSLDIEVTPDADIHFQKVTGATKHDTIIKIKNVSNVRTLRVNILGTVTEEKNEKK